MNFCTLASGSSGNAACLQSEDTCLLIDAGISARRINCALTGSVPKAVLITHEHDDHVKGLPVFLRQCEATVYASHATAEVLIKERKVDPARICTFNAGDSFVIGDITVRSFPLSHDAAAPVGYRFDCDGGSAAVLTDTGYVTEEAADAVAGVALLLLEANYDPETLRSGPYPRFLKERVLGRHGHLSNADAANFALHIAKSGTQEIILAHLSRENNTPVMAEYAVARKLQMHGLNVRVSVAPRDTVGEKRSCEKFALSVLGS